MGQPYPPAGAQKQYNERPLKVFGEQYLDGQPLPIGVVVEAGGPPTFTIAARVYLPDGPRPIVVGEWVISNRYTGAAVAVLSNEEFSERFGGGGAEVT
jgi:hypothetical protein